MTITDEDEPDQWPVFEEKDDVDWHTLNIIRRLVSEREDTQMAESRVFFRASPPDAEWFTFWHSPEDTPRPRDIREFNGRLYMAESVEIDAKTFNIRATWVAIRDDDNWRQVVQLEERGH